MIDLSVLKPNGRFIFLEIDFSSGEPVCLCEITKCKAWQYIFENQLDLYKVIANDVYSLGIDIYQDIDVVKQLLDEYVSKVMRDVTKISCLAIMYEESPRAFSYRSGITLEEAEFFYKQFYIKYPEILAYKKRIRQVVQEGKVIETLSGRRRSTYLPKTGDWRQDNRNFNSMIRKMTNFPTQSLLADIMCLKAYDFVKFIVDYDLSNYIQLVNVIHDSCMFLLREELVHELKPKLQSMMENMGNLPFPFNAPLRTSSKQGYTWSEMKKV